jgi:hypothetical protein
VSRFLRILRRIGESRRGHLVGVTSGWLTSTCSAYSGTLEHTPRRYSTREFPLYVLRREVTHGYATAPLTEIIKEPGLSDLPTAVKGKLGLALKAEAQGDREKAERMLNEAVQAEQVRGTLKK